MLALQVVMGWILLANAMTMGLRLVALFARAARRRPRREHGAPRLADYKKLPRVSILVPLKREEAVAERLLEALGGDGLSGARSSTSSWCSRRTTRSPARRSTATALPPTIEVVTVPADTLQTKPRAMNYALPFCRGDIVGVYDAEDRPDPGADPRGGRTTCMDAPPEVACVQGYLDFYNAARQLAVALLHPRIRDLVPGGAARGAAAGPADPARRHHASSSAAACWRRSAAWDAHNVTEDADLGMRLARFGYRCEMIASTTWEEANCRAWPWIRQRSRWLKGYAITWATHMRRPARALARPRAARASSGFQVLFLGGDHLVPVAAAVLGDLDRRRSASASPSGQPSRPG